MVVKVGDAILDVDNKEDDIGLLDGQVHLLVDLALEDVLGVDDPTAGVDHAHLHAVPLHEAILAVTGGATGVVDDGRACLREPIE